MAEAIGVGPLPDQGTSVDAPRVLDERYELGERVGSGGMADVWRARDRRLQREVAVKILPAYSTGDERQRARLAREARALAASSHPNIVTVYDYGEANDGPDRVTPFLVMELVEGRDLARTLEETGPMPVRKAQELVGAVCAGVAHAHRAGVVHGDLKPANILMGPHGPKVGDFGVARILDEETGTTTVAATPSYAAPEVLRGERATFASDVYSAACILFHALTGKPPFAGNNAWEVASKHLEEPAPKIKRLRPDVSPEIAAAISRGMDKRPRWRYPDIASFAEAIGVQATVVTTPPVPVAVAGPNVEDDAARTQKVEGATPTPPVVERTEVISGIEPEPGVRGWLTPQRMLIPAVIALLAVVVFAFTRDGSAPPRTVPDVAGQVYTEAAAELRLEGYDVDVSFRPITEGKPGAVLETIPEAGTVLEGDANDVHLVVGVEAATPRPEVQPASGGGGGGGGGKGKGRKGRDRD